MHRYTGPALKVGGFVFLMVSLLYTVGCSHVQVRPLPNRDVAGLDADAVVDVMQRAGFSDDEILDLGTDLRNSLSERGAAQVLSGRKTEAIFAVQGPYIHVSSRRRNGFIYNIETRETR
jgi:hypothetical protein